MKSVDGHKIQSIVKTNKLTLCRVANFTRFFTNLSLPKPLTQSVRVIVGSLSPPSRSPGSFWKHTPHAPGRED